MPPDPTRDPPVNALGKPQVTSARGVVNAVLLVAGDKSGRWREWYAEAIPAAEAAYKAYLEGQR